MGSKEQPELRFSGFNDDWKELRLGDVTNRVKGNDGRMDLPTLTISAGAGWLDQRERFSGNIAGKEQKNYTLLKKGQLSYNHGNSKLAKYGAVFELRTYEEALVPRVYHSFEANSIVVPDFIEYMFATKKPDRELGKLISSGARMDGLLNINYDDFMGIKIEIPSIDEQKDISKLLRDVDITITLHQQELTTLQQTKQGFLQKMFPNEGEKVPEVRFPGFTDDWEQRKFNDCFDFPVSTNSLSRAMLNYKEGKVKSVHYGDILIKYPSILDVKNAEIPYITGGNLEKYKSNLLENGDLIFADAAEDETVGKAVEVNGITDENLVSGLHTIVARAKERKAEYFLGYYINSNIYQRQLLRLMQGSKVSAISKGNLQKTDFCFPNDILEQKKIGSFFKQLDEIITLYQRKLELLQLTKKAFLQKLFV
ncbi:restriction endonuclease subunit S [Enterococcus gilvus]|uniref:restriction endonuclease subunit S n=1 Tax=Enterococcus gilvus TaxID=160453 RepID=UPI003D6C2FC0